MLLCIYGRLKKRWENDPDFVDEKIKAVLMDIFNEPLSALEANLVSDGSNSALKPDAKNSFGFAESAFKHLDDSIDKIRDFISTKGEFD